MSFMRVLHKFIQYILEIDFESMALILELNVQ